MVKGLAGKPCVEWLRSFGLLTLEETEGRPHWSLQHLHEGKRRGRYLPLHSCDQWQDARKWHERAWLRGGYQEKILLILPEGSWTLEWAPQGSGHKVQEAFAQCSHAQGVVLGISCAGPGAGPDDHCPSFPFSIFCDYTILSFSSLSILKTYLYWNMLYVSSDVLIQTPFWKSCWYWENI